MAERKLGKLRTFRDLKNLVLVVTDAPGKRERSGVWVDGKKVLLPKDISLYFVSDDIEFTRVWITRAEEEHLKALLDHGGGDHYDEFIQTTILKKVQTGQCAALSSIAWVPDMRLSDFEPSRYDPFSCVVTEVDGEAVLGYSYVFRGYEGTIQKAAGQLVLTARHEGRLEPDEGPVRVEELLRRINKFADSGLNAYKVTVTDKGRTTKKDGAYVRTIRYAHAYMVGQIDIWLKPSEDGKSAEYKITIEEKPREK